jgi:O-acetyl-ADP-ribose deacetylase (regulator of RNase III)
MPFHIIRSDITKVHADAIVNSANPDPVYQGAVDREIYLAAGADQLLAERKKIGKIATGEAAWTHAFALPAKYIIHTAGPEWIDGKHGETEAVCSCYRSSLKLALKLKCQSIAFPLLSSGAYGFPKDEALEAAASVLFGFCLHHEMDVILVIYDETSFDLSSRLFTDVKEYIDANTVKEMSESVRRSRRGRTLQAERSLQELLAGTSESFGKVLAEMIRKRGLKSSEVYQAANITRQTFSNLLHDCTLPKRQTVASFAVGLRLSLREAEKLYEAAGYFFSSTNRFDVCIRYFLTHQRYNIVEDNIILSEEGLPLLGAK